MGGEHAWYLDDFSISELRQVDIAVSDGVAGEPADDGEFLVTLSSPYASDVSIPFTVAGTATPGADYVTIGSSVTILAGTVSATIPVVVLNDGILDGGEDIVITLDMSTGYLLGNRSAAINFFDDEAVA